MELAYRRHDKSDHVWALLAPHLPDRPGVWGVGWRMITGTTHAVFWILRTGAQWRDLPPSEDD